MADLTRNPFQLDDNLFRRARYWTHELYHGIDNEGVEIIYCTTRQKSESVAATFLKEPIVGFDMEWHPSRSRGPTEQPSVDGGASRAAYLKGNISLIQVATESRIALFHIARHAGSTVAELVPPSLRRLIESAAISKAGVAVHKADGMRLRRFFKLKPRGMAELSYMHNVVTYAAQEPSRANKRLVALKTLTLLHLGLPLAKGPVRTSDWTRPLNEAQTRYAAADAYAGFMIYKALERKRLAMRPVQPRPAHAELYQPIELVAAQPAEETVAKESSLAAGSTAGLMLQRVPTLDQVGTRVLDALMEQRTLLADRNACWPHEIATDRMLERIAHFRPTNVDQLTAICHIDRNKAAKFGLDWMTIIQQDSATIPSDSSFPKRFASKPLAMQREIYLSMFKALRNRLATANNLSQNDVATDGTLRYLVEQGPQSVEHVSQITRAKTLVRLAAAEKCDLKKFLQMCPPEEGLPRAPLGEIAQGAASFHNVPEDSPRVKRLAADIEVIDLVSDDETAINNDEMAISDDETALQKVL